MKSGWTCKATDFLLLTNERTKSHFKGEVISTTSSPCPGEEPGTTTYQICKKYGYFNHAFKNAEEMKGYLTFFTHKHFNLLKYKDQAKADEFKVQMEAFTTYLEGKFDKLRFFINDTWDINGVVIFCLKGLTSGTFFYLVKGMEQDEESSDEDDD